MSATLPDPSAAMSLPRLLHERVPPMQEGGHDLVGGLAALFLLISGRKRCGDEVAFGPFLSFGIWIAFLFGDDLLRLYGAYFCG